MVATIKPAVRCRRMLPRSCLLRLVVGLSAMLSLLCGSPLEPARAQTPAASTAAEPEVPDDPYGRTTPEGTITGFVAALADEDYARASLYLDLSAFSATRQRRQGPVLAQQLRTLLDRGGQILPRAVLSNAAAGTLDDGLAPERDRVGVLEAGDQEIALLVERVEQDDGQTLWLIADETLKALPELLAADQQALLDQWLPVPLVENEFWGAPVGHWLVLLALAVLGYLIGKLVVGIVLIADRWWWRRQHRTARSFLQTVAAPLQLWVAVMLVYAVAPRIGVSIVAREFFGRALDVVGWIAIAWLLSRVIDAAGRQLTKQLQRRGRAQIVSVAAFIRRLLKALIFALAVIAILDTLGYDVTAGLAALGIGGLVLALGAQKTVENLIAGVSVLADQPVRVGEFCKVGDTQGTVEELGMRSARLRTNDQTLVVIPNSDFAAKQIENYSRREQFWFHPIVNLRLDTRPDLVRKFLEALRTLLGGHPRFKDGPPRVRLLGIGNDRLPIEIFGFVKTADYDEFLAVQEELTLDILDLLDELGMSLAAPATSVDVEAGPIRARNPQRQPHLPASGNMSS